MSADPTTAMAALGVKPTYSAQEAAAMLGRSYSWIDQRLRKEEFVLTVVLSRPCRPARCQRSIDTSTPTRGRGGQREVRR